MKKVITYLFSLLLIGALAFLYSFSSVKNSSKKIHKVDVEFVGENNYFLTQSMVNKLLIQNQRREKPSKICYRFTRFRAFWTL